MADKNLKDFIISLDLKKNPVEELRYDQLNNELKIYITPKSKTLTIEDFEFSHDGEEINLENIKILGSLMARLRFNKEKNFYWSALLVKDEIERPIAYRELIEELRNHVPGIKTLIIFNEKESSFAWSENKNTLQNLQREKRGRFIDGYLEFPIDPADFKNEIKKILVSF